MGKHFDVCGHVPLDCPNKCSDEKILRQDLSDHIEKSCPLHMVGCEFVHLGCSEMFCRKDRADHMTHSQAAHLSLVMSHLILREKKCDELQSSHDLLKEKYATLECQNEVRQKELLEHHEKKYDELQSSHGQLKKKYAALERQNKEHQREYQELLEKLKSDFDETLRLRSLRARQHELEHASRLPPQPEGLPRVFCMENCKNFRYWSTGEVRIHGVDLTFNISFVTRYSKRSRDEKMVYVEGNGSRTSSHLSPFQVSFEMLHSEDEVNNVIKPFDVKFDRARAYRYTVSFSPQRSILIENTADFKWESYMINQSLYFRVTVTK